MTGLAPAGGGPAATIVPSARRATPKARVPPPKTPTTVPSPPQAGRAPPPRKAGAHAETHRTRAAAGKKRRPSRKVSRAIKRQGARDALRASPTVLDRERAITCMAPPRLGAGSTAHPRTSGGHSVLLAQRRACWRRHLVPSNPPA